jgi:prefoldin subunit 5
MAKTNYSVVRNEGYTASSFNVRERHNERKNESYYNGDIEPERAPLNVHFLRHFREDGTPETYEETFKRLTSEGVISDKWHKPKSKSFDELVFDVNTDYFERSGGYEYAKKFYEEAYRCAVNEIGGEQYILSAVLHADERNKALSEELGRDVYHYHLHVVYVPVVEKREYFRKKKDEPDDAPRKLKAVYAQISHAKKWPGKTPVERDGKQIQINAYSLLQDRYFEHMRAAGFEGFERGKLGSTKEHLEVVEYKVRQEEKRLASLTKQAEKKQARIEKLDANLSVKTNAKATLDEINAMGKSALLGGVNFTDAEAKRLKLLVKKGVGIDKRADEYKKKIVALDGQIRDLNGQINDWKQSCQTAAQERDTYKHNYDRLWNEVKPFIQAIRKFPQTLLDFIRERMPQKSHSQEVSR